MTETQGIKHNWRFKDLTGQQFGRLTVVEWSPPQYGGATMWLCQCNCSNNTIVVVSYSNLKSRQTQSCGCQRVDNGRARRTHGMVRSPEYNVWIHAKSRCFNPKNGDYHKYGARGITMSKEWTISFPAFYADMGPRPSAAHSLDRIDNDGPYTGPCAEYPRGNCRWATTVEQSNNRRPRRFYPPKVGRYWSKRQPV